MTFLSIAGMLLPGLFLVLGGYFGNTVLLALTFLSLALFFGGMVMAGFNSNHLDIAPKYAGILMGITNTAATVPGILGPYVAKWIAKAVSSCYIIIIIIIIIIITILSLLR